MMPSATHSRKRQVCSAVSSASKHRCNPLQQSSSFPRPITNRTAFLEPHCVRPTRGRQSLLMIPRCQSSEQPSQGSLGHSLGSSPLLFNILTHEILKGVFRDIGHVDNPTPLWNTPRKMPLPANYQAQQNPSTPNTQCLDNKIECSQCPKLNCWCIHTL